ncbi:MAG: diguanylate cyclase [Candidatus Latescibacter sp.]|nr:diguanylate cyclase [Candidatus Latescibacter sp.]
MPQAKPVILIVDNEIEICNLFRDFINFMGYDSLFETDGEKLLSELDSIKYDVMFLDLKLGLISGVDILQKSKKTHPDSEVIIVTGHGSDETVLTVLHNGAMSYIQKPISFSGIKVHTEEALAKRRFNMRTNALKKTMESCAPSLIKHFTDIINLDKLSTYLNLTIDIETLADLILNGIADILPGYYYSFFFFDEVNREMVIYSEEQVYSKTASKIEEQIKVFYENLVNRELEGLYNVRVILPAAKKDSEEIKPIELISFFVPLLVDNSIKGVIGISGENTPVPDDSKDILLMISARTNKILSNATLHRDTKMLALTDGLTGLLNHRAINERLKQEFERFRRYGSFLSLLVADFDDLKKYNDTYGHPVGDEVLRHIGNILRETSRESDVLSRYGGDEFVILLPQTNSRNASNMAERIKQKVQDNLFSIHGLKLKGTISMGVATVPDETIQSPQDFLESADRALYDAKRSGKNRICIAGSLQ